MEHIKDFSVNELGIDISIYANEKEIAVDIKNPETGEAIESILIARV